MDGKIDEIESFGLPAELSIKNKTEPLYIFGTEFKLGSGLIVRTKDGSRTIVWKSCTMNSAKEAEGKAQMVRNQYENAKIALGDDFVVPTSITVGQDVGDFITNQKLEETVDFTTYRIHVYQIPLEVLGERVFEEVASLSSEKPREDEIQLYNCLVAGLGLDDFPMLAKTIEEEFGEVKEVIQNFYLKGITRGVLLGYFPDTTLIPLYGDVRHLPIVLSGNLGIDQKDGRVKLFDFGFPKLDLFPLPVRRMLSEHLDKMMLLGQTPITGKKGEEIKLADWYKAALIKCLEVSGLTDRVEEIVSALENGLSKTSGLMSSPYVSEKAESATDTEKIKAQTTNFQRRIQGLDAPNLRRKTLFLPPDKSDFPDLEEWMVLSDYEWYKEHPQDFNVIPSNKKSEGLEQFITNQFGFYKNFLAD